MGVLESCIGLRTTSAQIDHLPSLPSVRLRPRTFLYYTGEGSAATKGSGKASVCDLLYCFGIDVKDSLGLTEEMLKILLDSSLYRVGFPFLNVPSHV